MYRRDRASAHSSSATGTWSGIAEAAYAISSARVSPYSAHVQIQEQRHAPKEQHRRFWQLHCACLILSLRACAQEVQSLRGAEPLALLCCQVDAAYVCIQTSHLKGHAAALAQSRGGWVCSIAYER